MKRALPVIAAFLMTAQILAAQAAPRVAASNAKITKSQIVAFLENDDKATKKMDVKAICASLAPDVRIKIHVKDGPTLVFNRDQYKAYTKESLAAVEGYGHSRRNTKISIAKAGQSAQVSADVYEVMVVQGRTMRTATATRTTLKPQSGKIVITSMLGTMYPY